MLAQSVGYVASGIVGPFAVGVIRDWLQSWPVVAIFYSAIAFVALLLGLGAGRARTVTVATHNV